MKLNGKNWLLFYDDTTPLTTALTAVTTANAKLIGCLNTNGFNMTNETIDVSSKCSGRYGEFLPGTSTTSMSGDGLFEYGADIVGEVGAKELFQITKNGDIGWWFLLQVDDNMDIVEDGLVIYSKGLINSFDLTGDNNAGVGFSISVQGIGEPGDDTTLAPTP